MALLIVSHRVASTALVLNMLPSTRCPTFPGSDHHQKLFRSEHPEFVGTTLNDFIYVSMNLILPFYGNAFPEDEHQLSCPLYGAF